MRMLRVIPAIAFCAGVGAAAVAAPTTTIAEPFDGTIDQASWRVSTADEIVSSGGHPGNYLHVPDVDFAVPRITTVDPQAAQFLGDYRARGVVGAGVDIDLFSVSISADARPVTLLLFSDMGTPDDPSDDCEAATVSGKNLPKPGMGWRSFEYKVPSQSTTLPQGWQLVGACGNLPPDAAWDFVVQHVQRASFDLGEPGFFYFFQIWSIGVDNPRIVLRKTP